MAKNKVSEWSATPANNTDIANIDIAEGCAPSGINNAIREIMAQVKDMQTGADGDDFNVGGDLYVADDATIADTLIVQNATIINGTLRTDGTHFALGGVTGNLTGNVTGNVSGSSGSCTGNSATATLATTAESCTGNSATATALSTATGSAPSYGARAFVTFDGTGTVGTNMTLLSSGNVSSVYKNAVGDYTVNFNVALPSANYVMSGASKFLNPPPEYDYNEGHGASISFSGYTPPTASACRVWNVWLQESAGAINIVQPADTDRISLVFFI